MAMEVRDSLEITHTGEYLNFLKCYFRAFSAILYHITKPQFTDNPEHKLRNVVVEILNRLPHSEVLRPFVQDLLKVAMHVLTTDNEENGLICIRIIFDLLRNFRPTLENEVQPFLDFVCKIYQNFRLTVTHFFESGAVLPPPAPTISGSNSTTSALSTIEDVKPLAMDISDQMGMGHTAGAGQLNPSTRSFKIVTESPLVVMFLFQLYSRLVQTNIPHLLPQMVAAISIPGPEKVPPHLKGHFVELKGAQVKTVSFLTYLLKSFADWIRPHEESICKSIVNLLVTCSDSVSIRKELLVALKHVLGTDFKRGLFPLIDTLLEERVLVGTGRACFETLRPLAYSLLAEIVHHVRGDLSLSQLSRIIYLFSSNMHDASLSLSIHTTCARLMLNLVEPIFEKGVDLPSMDEARILLGRILDAFVGKFSTFKRTIPQLLEEGEEGKDQFTLRSKLELPVQAVLNLQVPVEHSKEVSDCKHLIKTLVMGMKTIIWSITHAHLPRSQVSPSIHGTPPQPPQANLSIPQPFKGMREDEVWKASGVLKSGVHCLALFKEKDEEREMVHLFSQILAIMEPRDLMDMFSLCMPELFECMISNTQLVHIFSTLLQAPKVFRPFADVLVNFLVSSKLDVLKHPDSPAAKLVLHLFRFLFGAVAKAPSDCERILQPHVPVIMETCMKNAAEVERPLGHLQLLRTMFRALAGGKFEHLLRDLIPTLQPCLNMLLAMLEGPIGDDMRDLLLELCLTLPARLSSLLPHLPRLMKPLVLCLNGSGDLVSLGLRTLEFWIDSLNPDFLEPSMASVMSEVNLALWSHLRPAPYLWGGKSLQLLGKLGGRNRRFLKEPLALECKENPEHGLRVILTFEPSTPFLVPLDRCINLAVAAVMHKNNGVDAFYRKQALKFLRVCLSSQLNLPGNIVDESFTCGHLSTILNSAVDSYSRRAEMPNIKADLGVKTKTQLMAEKSVFKILLMTIIATSAEPELHDPKDESVVNICRHFAILFHIENASGNTSSSSATLGGSLLSSSTKSRNNSSTNLKELDPMIFLDALVEVLADENRTHAKSALSALNVFAETLLFLARSRHNDALLSRGGPGTPMIVSSPSMSPVYSPPASIRIPVFEQLLPRLLHCCYGSTWQAQIGGVMGLGALVGKVTVETLCIFQVRIIRGLVYVLKRLPVFATKEQEETSQVLTQVLRVVNNVDEANSEARRQSFQGVVEFLASELFNANASLNVRKIVQSCLALLASRTGSEVSELLEPLYQPLLQPLIVRSLRAKTVDQQVGTVTALNFCLALRPPLLKLTQELVSFLQDALQIAEADESVWVVKFMNPKVVTSLNKLRTACIELLCTAMAWADFKTQNQSELRAKVISMFFKSLTSRTPEIVAVAKEGLRQVILQQRMPKELLQSSLRPILVNLAHTKNLSMPLLQGLARLLELLSNWFNVTLGGKLLEHLKKWLEPEKLAQCQKAWKPGEEPKIAAAIIELFHLLPNAAGKFLDELVTLTIDLETALPPGQFYSEINSPYRLPLTKFLNKYPTAGVDYFLARLNQPKYFRRFMYIIRSDAGQPLREELAKSPDKILANAFSEFLPKSEASAAQATFGSSSVGDEALVAPPPEPSNQPAAAPAGTTDAYFQGLALIKTLVKLMPGWLHSNRAVFDILVLLWKSTARIARLQNEQELNLVQVKESKWLVKCFLNYLRNDKTEVNVLFDILSIFLFHTRIDFTFLKEFYIIEVAEGYETNMKKTLLSHFLDIFQSKQLGHDHLVVIMQMLILPMLAHTFQNNQTWDVVDTSIIKTVVDSLLDPPEEVSADYDEPLRIELLQLATLLLKYLQTDLVHHRKELIKFGWNHLKREDSASKQWAFVNVCHFLEAYQAPEKIILQVFVALLRTCQPENKMLVKQALDILMPALPRRLPMGDSRMPIWIRYTKKILVEEGHSVPNLIHIFQLIVRHSDLFYNCRAQFVPQMVNSLSRLGLPYNTTTENRRLAIELAGLVVSWERQRQKETTGMVDGDLSIQNSENINHSSGAIEPKRPVEGSTFSEDLTKRLKVEPGLQSLPVMSPGGPSPVPNIETPGSAGQPDEEFKPNAAMEEMIINFLIRVALVIEPKDKEANLMYKQALELLSQALDVWPNANVKFNYLEKLLSSIQPTQSKDPSTALAQGLDVMNKVLEKQPHLFIRNNISQISQILEPCFKYKMLDAGKSLCSLLKMVFLAFPSEAASTPPEVKTLYTKVNDLIQKHLGAVAAPQTAGEDNSAQMISFVLFVMKTLAEVQENIIDPYNLVRVFQRLARDMGSATGSYVKQGQRIDPDSAVSSTRQGGDLGVIIDNLKSVLKLISQRVMLVPDCKRLVTQILNSLLSEKGTDQTVLLCVLDVIKGWIEDNFGLSGMAVAPSNFLMPKEVVAFVQKLSQVDKLNFSTTTIEEWDSKYLQILYALCADSNKFPLSLRQEVFQKIERQFLLGLRAKDPEIRMKFFSLYHESMGKTLFTRLQYIIQIQDWEALSDVFWLKQGLDLLLAILVEDKPITLAPNSAKLPSLLVASSLSDISAKQPMITDATESAEDGPLTFDALVLKHGQFLSQMSRLQVADLVVPLRELAHTDPNVAYHLWVLVFPIVWVTLHKEEQVALAKPMINLLSKDYHKKQQSSRPNVVQALMEGLQLSHPQPRMPSELIKYIGKTYNAWHIALGLLESHVMLFLNDSKCSESLAELYRLLNEEDMRCGLWKKRSMTAETRAGLSLVQHGYWQRAQSLFYQAMLKATQGTYSNTVPKAEMCLWEEQWLYCASQLSQWDVLVDFGKLVENYEILLDSLWKQPDWTYLKDHVIPKAQVEETPKLRIIQAYFSLHENKTNGVADAENIVGKGVDLALEQWWQLPEMSIHSRIPLLHQFQQLVEIQESARVIVDIANGNKSAGTSAVGMHGGLYADLKDILETWRLRTPNEWDNSSVWYDLLQWRNEMYNSVIDAFKDFGSTNSQLHHLGYRDKAWNVNKLAHIARKQGLHDVCVSILDKMYGHSTMEVQEAFVKIREQAKAYLEMKGELTNGLNLINSTNLEYFPVKHKAEIFRLKGDFLLKLSDCEGANLAYSNAISLFKNLPKGWISWGNYCDMAYKETNDEMWLEYAVSCFLQGIKFGIPNSRSHLARVLYLLSFDTPNEPVGRAFDKYLEQIPHWVWLSWIPQLLLSLQRTEASHCKLVLLKIATIFPQALYYWLRTYLLERRDVANKSEFGRMAMAQQRMQQNASFSGSVGLADSNARLASHGGGSLTSDNQVHQGNQASGTVASNDGANTQMQDSERSSAVEGGGNDQSLQQTSSNINDNGQNGLRRTGALGLVASAASAFDAAKDVMEALRSKHNNLASELEILLTEIGSRFVTLPEERLLAVVNALLHRCYKYPTATTAEVPQSLKKELSGVCRACFSADAVNKHVEFVREYKQEFERDLDPESTTTFPATLSELTERLKHWKNVLQSNVEDRFPAVLKLEEESRVLRDFHVVDVEVPGQYFTDQEVAPDHTIKLDRVGADVPIVRRHGSSFRRLTLIGSDGSQRHFIVQTSLTPNARSDERMLQLFRVMNQMFDKHKESRRRHICIHTPIIIPVWSQVRMVEDDLMYSTFLEVYENHCARNDREADLPITYFKEQLNQAISGQISPDAVVDLRLQAYNDITKNVVTDSIFSQYMYKTLLNGNHMWAFKKQFAIQLALSSFVSFMLQIGGRSPNKILFAKNTGKIFQTDFHPAYDANGMIEFNEPVPFRLTRNLQAFFSHFGVEGLIVSAMSSAAQAVVSPKQSQHLWHHLAMFFRDELLSWSWRRPLGINLGPVVGGSTLNPTDFRQKITTNVEHVIDRINSIAPQYISEEEENAVDPPQSVQRGVTELVEAALTPRNLCMMDPTWHPWF